MGARSFLHIDSERFTIVYRDISEGSKPGLRFYLLVAISTLIASFGLLANSTAVVIGAMLVAPLMTPIFGISLALIRGDTSLFSSALKAEIIGVIASITMSCLLGFFVVFANPFPEATPEMLARTSPNLYDLLVAVLSGLAGAYALVDEKISPALPGVAIATAIVPPLANSGLCLAYGAYHGALGSFLLFFANFLSILLVSSLVFVRADMARESKGIRKTNVVHRFGFVIVSFLMIAIFLGNALYEMATEHKLYNSVRKILITELAEYPAIDLKNLLVDTSDTSMNVLAEIQSPSQLTPNQVKLLEDTLSNETQTRTNLIIRTIKANDISSIGSGGAITAQTLDGFYINPNVSPVVQTIRMADQILNERLQTELGLDLDEIRYFDLLRGPTIVATIKGVRPYPIDLTKMLEELLQKKIGNPDLNLVVRFIQLDLFDREGVFLFGWSGSVKDIQEEQRAVVENLIVTIREMFQEKDSMLLGRIHHSIEDEDILFLLELDGHIPYQKEDVAQIQQELSDISGHSVKLSLWMNNRVVLTDTGLQSSSEFMATFLAAHDNNTGTVTEILDSQR